MEGCKMSEVINIEKFYNHDTRIALLEKSVSDISCTLVKIENKMDAGFEAINRRFEVIDKKMDFNYEKLDKKMDFNFDHLNNKIDSNVFRLESKIDKLDHKIDFNYEKLDKKMDGGFARLDKKIDSGFKWLLSLIIAQSTGLLAVMAHGFHWI